MLKILQEILVPRRQSPFSPNNFPALLTLKLKTDIFGSPRDKKGVQLFDAPDPDSCSMGCLYISNNVCTLNSWSGQQPVPACQVSAPLTLPFYLCSGQHLIFFFSQITAIIGKEESQSSIQPTGQGGKNLTPFKQRKGLKVCNRQTLHRRAVILEETCSIFVF